MSQDKKENFNEEYFDKKQLENLDSLIQKTSMNIRNGNREWLRNPGLCEVCGVREATVNLDLTFGSHRECRICWND
jgi:hypothetical protein